MSRELVNELIATGELRACLLPGSTHETIPASEVARLRAERQAMRAGIDQIVDDLVDAGAEYWMDEPRPGRRAVPDTNVRYPTFLPDLIIRLAEVGAHTVVWSDDLLAELEQVWTEGRAAGKRVPNAHGAASALARIRRTFQASFVPRSAYETGIDVMPGDDDDDEPHLAAAEVGGATHIVTRDRAGGLPVADVVARRTRTATHACPGQATSGDVRGVQRMAHP